MILEKKLVILICVLVGVVIIVFPMLSNELMNTAILRGCDYDDIELGPNEATYGDRCCHYPEDDRWCATGWLWELEKVMSSIFFNYLEYEWNSSCDDCDSTLPLEYLRNDSKEFKSLEKKADILQDKITDPNTPFYIDSESTGYFIDQIKWRVIFTFEGKEPKFKSEAFEHIVKIGDIYYIDDIEFGLELVEKHLSVYERWKLSR